MKRHRQPQVIATDKLRSYAIYLESRDLDHPLGFVAEHQYLVYIPDGEDLNYNAWLYIGGFPTDGNGSLLTGGLSTDILFKGADHDTWTIDEFQYTDVIDVGALLVKNPSCFSLLSMLLLFIAAGH